MAMDEPYTDCTINIAQCGSKPAQMSATLAQDKYPRFARINSSPSFPPLTSSTSKAFGLRLTHLMPTQPPPPMTRTRPARYLRDVECAPTDRPTPPAKPPLVTSPTSLAPLSVTHLVVSSPRGIVVFSPTPSSARRRPPSTSRPCRTLDAYIAPDNPAAPLSSQRRLLPCWRRLRRRRLRRPAVTHSATTDSTEGNTTQRRRADRLGTPDLSRAAEPALAPRPQAPPTPTHTRSMQLDTHSDIHV
ncbi:hypothetical protein K438DRAFT_1938826 [Mycena galopus ATCC 62051]|nr:hypothetical protein K438DRAFT_1938826 [Mycena galopus ATCC 62051]